MRFNINNLGFKRYTNYSDRHLAKAYVVYAIECERPLNNQEFNILSNVALKFSIRKNRIYVDRILQKGKTIIIIGKQSHGYGYSWDDEILNAFYPLFNSI